MANFQPATVTNEGGWFTVYGPDPYDQYVYSLAIPVDVNQRLSIGAVWSASEDVPSPAFQLFLWLGSTDGAARPSGTGYITSTQVTAELTTDEQVYDNLFIVKLVAGKPAPRFLRMAFRVNTCAAGIPGVTATVHGLSVISRGTADPK